MTDKERAGTREVCRGPDVRGANGNFNLTDRLFLLEVQGIRI